MDTINQIMPASGWHAAYEHPDGSLETHPLICWALFEDADGCTYVDGISDDPFSTFQGEQEVGNFLCYVPPDADAETYAKQFQTGTAPDPESTTDE